VGDSPIDIDHGAVILLIERKLIVKKIGNKIDGLRRRMASDINRDSGFGRHIDKIFRQPVVTGQDNAGYFEPYKIFKDAPPLMFLKMVQKPRLGISKNLNTLVGKKVGKTGKCKPRTMQVAFENPALLLIDIVEASQLDIVLPADIIKKICDRY
jgi:hypothetical protein